MESLSPECTPLKHRYDSCFNAWFEGYLQPALSAAAAYAPAPVSGSAVASASAAGPSTSSAGPSAGAGASTAVAQAQGAQGAAPLTTTGSKKRTPIITSWASAFPSRPRRSAGHHPAQGAKAEESHWFDFGLSDEQDEGDVQEGGQEVEQVDTSGKTRAQVKAEEYQRNCGKFWDEYQGCLKTAIAQNESLSSLLATAREEHPLGRLDGLKGTPWDSKADYTGND
ncbi:hypothetical protein IAU60_001492 [Kwoniella sp. DSM 27419]